jgi:CheY-like chemotaxis protein
MDEAVKTEVRKIALGFDLKYKISNMRMETYIAPEYLQLRRRHSELHFVEFIDEVVKVRAEARTKAGKQYDQMPGAGEFVLDAHSDTTDALTEVHAGNHILWVDDHPENNACWRPAFEAVGFRFTLALSTEEALERLSQTKYAAIISDMDRREGPREGYVLLDRLRKEGNRTPLFFFSSSAPEHKFETYEHDGQGCTNDQQELFEMVTRAVIERRTA